MHQHLSKIFWMHCFTSFVGSSLLLYVVSSSAIAQSNGFEMSPIQPASPPLPLPNIPKTEPTLRLPAITFPESIPTVLDPTDDSTESITLDQFDFVGNTAFSIEELNAVVQPFVGIPITFDDLLKARMAVTQLYIDQGYLTTGAYVPSGQVLDQRRVTIQILEGSLNEIQVFGNRTLNSDYVQSRIRRAQSTPLNIPELIEALQVLQKDPLIDQLSAALVPGVQRGTNDLVIDIDEAKSFNAHVILNNGRSPSIGSFQRKLKLQKANLTGRGDIAQLSYGNTNGSNEIDASYSVPLNGLNGTLSTRFNQVWSRVVQAPFERLNLNGTSRLINLQYRQPLILTPTQEFALGLELSRKESETTFLGKRFPLSLGADANGRTQLNEINLIQDWTQQRSSSVLAIRSLFSIGLDAFSTENPTAPDGEFLLWRGQAQWVKQFAPDTLFLLRSNLQFSDRALVSLERFGLGGLNSVRGYSQDSLLVDNGVFVSTEAQIPVLRNFNRQGTLSVVPFIDYGRGWNHDNRVIPGSNDLLAGGVGLRWQWRDRLSAQLHWGIPMISIATQKAGFQESQLFFSIQANLF